ncbi:MAG: response regulator transcription factor [Deltaproteobacteria bacterium]|nr:response regulator transcription factor [Deltaproteobacteria bacterium]
MPQILVIDDDRHIREVVEYSLSREGFGVSCASDGREGLARARADDIDLVVLDILMPEMDGFEVFFELRKTRNVPVIFLTSKSDEVDRIVGLEMGADDYLAKPFSPRELVARIRAVLRRQSRSAPAPAAAPATAKSSQITVGPLCLDPDRHEVTCHGQAIQLTATEFALLHTLLRRPGQVLNRAVLVDQVYSIGHHITERAIDTHIKRIRGKFRPVDHDPIETVHGVGYKARVNKSSSV